MTILFGPRVLLVAGFLTSSVAVAFVAADSDARAIRAAPDATTTVEAQALRAGSAFGARTDLPVHSFHFTRGAYSGRGRSWMTDAPQADRWIASVIGRLTLIDSSPFENYVALDDPELGRYPFLYILEVGRMQMRDSEVEGLRNYLLRGGFLMVDDFWGSAEWANWEWEIGRVLPEYEIVDIPLSHEIFSTMYLIDEVVQVPGVGGVQRGITSQRDGVVPYVRGIFDEKGRLMVMINWNTDLGDAWEWAEASFYPLHYSTYAYQVAANAFIYALTH